LVRTISGISGHYILVGITLGILYFYTDDATGMEHRRRDHSFGNKYRHRPSPITLRPVTVNNNTTYTEALMRCVININAHIIITNTHYKDGRSEIHNIQCGDTIYVYTHLE